MADQAPVSTPAAGLSRQRDSARRRLRRANTAVAVVLLSVLGLAAAAMVSSLRARRSQHRAEQAQAQARQELWRAYVAEIRDIRRDFTLDRRVAAMDAIRRAGAIATSPVLRREAVAALALPEFRLEHSWPFDPAVTAFQCNHDLRWVAFGQTNGDIVISSGDNWREAHRLRRSDGGIPDEQGAPLIFEFSRDARLLTARYQGGAFALWEIAEHRVRFRHDTDRVRRSAASMRFSGDGRILVGPVFTPRDAVTVFNAESGQILTSFSDLSSFRHVALRPGTTMFAANNGTNVVVKDWVTSEEVAAFPYKAGVRTLAWSADGRHLAIGGNLAETHVWDFDSRDRRVLTGSRGDVSGAVFDPEGERLATTSVDGTSRIWDLRDGRLLGLTIEGFVSRWATAGRVILDRPRAGLELRRFADSPVFQEMTGPVPESNGRHMDITPDGDWGVSVGGTNGLFLWNLRQGGPPVWEPMPGVRSVCFDPTSERRVFLTRLTGPELYRFEVATNEGRATWSLGEPTKLRGAPGYHLDCVTISADGRTLAWVDVRGGHVWVENLASGERARRILTARHNSVIFQGSSPRGGGTISLSPDGRWLAVGTAGNAGAVVYNSADGKLISQVSAREGQVQFSRDGRWLVVAGRNATKLVRTSDWSQAWEYRLARSEENATASISPDGAMVATVKSTRVTALLDPATGRELTELESPDGSPIVTTRWSDDSQRLVLATRDNRLQVWRPTALERELTTLGVAGPEAVSVPPDEVLDEAESGRWMLAGVVVGSVAIAGIALLSLRWHRRLIENVTQIEAVAAQRERELQGEREVRQLKDSFVSMVSHEFRTPLAIIQSSAQILERYIDRLPPEQRRDQVISITKNVRRMAGLIDEVLVLGKIEGGQLRCSPAPFALGPFCRKLADEMHSATGGRCPIQMDLPELPPASGDESLLRHILTNLLSNAVKYSAAGRPVSVRVTQDGPQACFVVRDEGVGIPAADRAKLFTAFHRGRNVGQVSGTGLGLTIVKRCVDVHGGGIAVESEEGRGTVFTVRLPLFESPNVGANPGPNS